MTTAGEAALLRLEGVGRRFGGFQALQEVSFCVPPSGITGLMGPNGSGKTTLFNIISGFLPPGTGQVLYRGRDIRHDTVQRRSRDGLVRTFQTPKLFERLTVGENVMVGAYKSGRSGILAGLARTRVAQAELATLRERSVLTCRRFGLGSVIDGPAATLSAGQRRLLELARAYQGAPALLLLDEPSSGLTSTEIEQLTEKLQMLTAEGVAILLVSHDMALMEIATQVHVLNFGRIIASGSMSSVQADPAVRHAYLGL